MKGRRTCSRGPEDLRWQKSSREELIAVCALDLEEVGAETSRYWNGALKKVQEATSKAGIEVRFQTRDSKLTCEPSRATRRSGGSGCRSRARYFRDNTHCFLRLLEAPYYADKDSFEWLPSYFK
jgi:hypothetical protein